MLQWKKQLTNYLNFKKYALAIDLASRVNEQNPSVRMQQKHVPF